MRDYIARVNSPEGQGSGFAIIPSKISPQVYIITARHCLANKKTDIPYALEEISIDFYREGEWLTYRLNASSKVAMGKSIQYEDIAVIVVNAADLPISLEYKESPKLGYVPDKLVDSEISGAPKVVLGESIRTLYQLKLLADSDYIHQIQIEVSDPMSEQYNADSLVDGYSGGPVVSYMQNQPLVSAIFLGYEKNTRRILGINIILVNRLLGELGEQSLEISGIETNQDIFIAIDKIDTNSDRILNRVRQQIGDVVLDRLKIRNDLTELIHKSKLVIATGKPGAGKSALVKSAISLLRSDFKVIAFQGEQLDKPSIDEIFSSTPLGLNVKIGQVLDSPAYTGNKIVLLDSIEKILETENSDTILDFLELLNSRDDIKMVMTCRSYAVEQLKMRFLQQYPAFDDYEIPLLDKKELEQIGSRYSNIILMLKNQTLAKILEIPFNLDKAVSLPESKLGKITSEKEFSAFMWEYVIENRNQESKPEIRMKRGEAFMSIAIKRASLMVAYVEIDNAEPDIIHGLIADNIIDKDLGLGQRFAAAHDIYEDWAITRFIEASFQRTVMDQGEYIEFYTQLGSAPAIRRGFRLWFSEKIENADEPINDLLKSTLKEAKISDYWKDEMLVAAMQSPYSKRFLSENKTFLFANNFHIFRKSLSMLTVACQEINSKYVGLLKGEEMMKLYYNINLMPFGEGWVNMLNFVYEHLSELKSQLPIIVNMIMEWKKGIDTTKPFPGEAEKAGKILIEYCKVYETGYTDEFEGSDNSDVKAVILLLFKLSAVIKPDLQTLIENAASYDNKSDNYRLRRFYRNVITLVLDGYENENICKEFPNPVMDIALKEWLYYPPTAEEEESSSLPSFVKSRRRDKENDFGLKDSGDLSYFPASPHQTPLLNLLFAEPFQTLQFLIKVLNHCGEAFVASDYGMNRGGTVIPEERSTITLNFEDGTENVQHASVTLWTAYRGSYIAMPNLLESILMALESFMLSLGKTLTSDGDDSYKEAVRVLWDIYFDRLLKESNNVMATSVLLSAAYAYPEFAAEKIFPLLRIKDFYLWDMLRVVNERNALSPRGTGTNAIARQKQLYDFQKLEHRNINLMNFVLKLSFGRHRSKVLEIVDYLYTLAPDDNDWQIRVRSMDFRKLKITEKVENGYLLETQLEPELQKVVEKNKEEAEHTNLLAKTSLFGMQQLDSSASTNITYESWVENYEIIKNTEKPQDHTSFFYQPGTIAGIGIRDYTEDMDEEQKQWCIDIICEIVNDEIAMPDGRFNLTRSKHNTSEVEMAFSVLPRLMHQSQGKEKEEFKKFIFLGLIKLRETSFRKALEKSFHSLLWSADPSFAKDCIRGLIQYASLSHYLQIRRNHISESDPEAISAHWLQRSWKKVFEKLTAPKPEAVRIQSHSEFDDKVLTAPARFESLVQSVATDTVALDYASFDFEDVSEDYLFEVMKLIPADTSDNELQEYYLKMVDFIFNNLDDNEGWGPERLHYQTLQIFEEEFSRFLLSQNYEIALKSLGALTEWSFDTNTQRNFSAKKYEFVERCLDEIVNSLILDNLKSDRFWKLWEHLIKKCISDSKMRFDKQLLMSKNFYGAEDFMKQEMNGRKHIYESFILRGANLEASIKLISGIGFSELMPDGIRWLEERTRDCWPKDETIIHYFEKLVIQSYYDSKQRKSLKGIASFRNAFIAILDRLIDKNSSSSAYVIREDFVSVKREIIISDDQNG